jgi:curved DNA-binding protein CbpA
MEENSKYNYYDILELNPQCAQNEVTPAYEKLKYTYGGDNPAVYTVFSQEEARQMLNLIEEAYSVLGNKALRLQYDESINLASKKSNDEPKMPNPVKKTSNFKPEFKQDDVIEAEIKSCIDWTGEMLKKVREYRNWPMDRLSEQTKISGYYINALELMDPKGLPAPVFVRGFVSQLCKFYFLDEKKVCDSYMKNFKNKLEQKN